MQPHNDQYNFILNPESPKRGPRLISKPRGTAQRALLVVGILAIVTVVGVVLFSVLSNIGKADNQDLIRIQAYQTEVLRMIDLGQKEVRDSGLRTDMTTLRAATETDLYKIGDILSKRKEPPTALQLAAKKDAKLEETLNDAKEKGTYDEAFSSSLQTLTSSYYTELRNARAQATTQIEKDALSAAMANLEAYAKQ